MVRVKSRPKKGVLAFGNTNYYWHLLLIIFLFSYSALMRIKKFEKLQWLLVAMFMKNIIVISNKNK